MELVQDNLREGLVLIATDPCIMDDTDEAALTIGRCYTVHSDEPGNFYIISNQDVTFPTDTYYFGNDWDKFFILVEVEPSYREVACNLKETKTMSPTMKEMEAEQYVIPSMRGDYHAITGEYGTSVEVMEWHKELISYANSVNSITSKEFVREEPLDIPDVRSHNVGTSNYSKHKIQPWDIWKEYSLNPWDADIVKRVLRTKYDNSRILDYEKIIHVCQERISQLKETT